MEKCRWCKKPFKKMTTLASHMCVKKKRFADKDTTGARLGLTVFQTFFRLTMNSTKPKTSDDFIDSKYYVDFVKFGRHLADLKPIDTERYVEFVIKNGVKLKDWTKDFVYETYLEDLVAREPAARALERTVLLMSSWSEANNTSYHNFFRDISTNEATFLIKTGKISPWVLYLSESGGELLDQFNAEQHKILETMLNPVFWQKKLTTAIDDTKFIKSALASAGI